MVHIKNAKWDVIQIPHARHLQELQIFSPEYFTVTLSNIREVREAAKLILIMLPLIKPEKIHQLLVSSTRWPVDCLYQDCENLFEELLGYLDVEDISTKWGNDFERHKGCTMPSFMIRHLMYSGTWGRIICISDWITTPIVLRQNDKKTERFRKRADRALTFLRRKCGANNFYIDMPDRKEILQLLVGCDLHQYLELFLKEDFQSVLISEKRDIYTKVGRKCDVCLQLLTND